MTAHIFRYSVLIVATALALTAQTRAQGGHALFEQALAKERVEGNLPEAIKLYERVAAEFASDRALAARALMQIGLSYEKLGRDEAVRVYERLVRDFADQADSVATARARLLALSRPAPGAAAAATAPRLRTLPPVDNINEVRTLSPDGTKAAFKSYDQGQNLAVFDLTTQRTTLLTNIDGTKILVESPAWSPDGRRIAYVQCGIGLDWPCELRVATLAGESGVIFRGSGAPAPAGWLPDGSALVVMLRRPADRTLSIGLVPAAGGSFTQLRSLSTWTGTYELPSVSPDGRYIAFADGPLGTRDIHVISRDGRMAHRITDHPAEDHKPVWSPDGRYLAFLSTRDGGKALWTVAMRDGVAAAEPVRIKEGMVDVLSLLGWTTRGLAYLDRRRSEDVYTVTVNPASGEPTGMPQQIPYGRTGRNAGPVWSPDGRFLAFGSYSPAEPDRRVVVVMPAGGGQAREFPIPTNRWPISGDGPNDLRWFADSRGLGFQGLDARDSRAIFRLTLATGEWNVFPVPVTNTLRTEWNADGSRVFYYAATDSSGGDPAIVERDLQSDRERVVLRGNAGDWSAARGLRFSPDRRLLALSDGQAAIRVLDIESGQLRPVYKEAEGDIRLGVPTWSHNGRALLVERTENESTDLRLIPIDGSEVRRIPLGPDLTRLLSRGTPRPTLRGVVWSPDGSRLAFVLQARRLETWVIENPLALAGATGASARK
jgi:Tol biopolymer transport system component